MAIADVWYICGRCVNIDGQGNEQMSSFQLSGEVESGDILTVYCERGHEIRAEITIEQLEWFDDEQTLKFNNDDTINHPEHWEKLEDNDEYEDDQDHSEGN